MLIKQNVTNILHSPTNTRLHKQSPDKEVDFVAMKDDRVIYLQATYMLETAQTMEREYAPLLTIGDNYEKYVVSMDEVQFPSNEGVRHIQAWNLKEIL